MKAKEVVETIIQQIEIGCPPWRLPWESSLGTGLPMNAATGQTYNGTNILSLWASQHIHEYETGLWIGYDQATKLGGQVRKGEKSSCGIIYKPMVKEDENGNERVIPFMRTFNVFNIDQIDGLDHLKPTLTKHTWEPIDAAERIMSDSGATIEYGGDRAFYSPKHDLIKLPEREHFKEASGFYATALHELGHWTGHESRLDRRFGKRFGDDAYAMEELIADICSAITQSSIGLQGEIENHASYLESWVKVLKEKPRYLLTVASAAQKASDWLMQNQENHDG